MNVRSWLKHAIVLLCAGLALIGDSAAQDYPARPLPFSAVEVPFLPVPGCTVQLDLWVYAP